MNKISKGGLAMVIVVVLAAGGGMFFAGMHYQESKASAVTQGRHGGSGGSTRTGPKGGNGRAGGGFASGEVIAKDNQSITVKMRDGSTRIIYFSGSTTVGKMDAGSANDLSTGERVIANGQTNPDGSIAAQDIQIRPAGSPGFGGYQSSQPGQQQGQSQ